MSVPATRPAPPRIGVAPDTVKGFASWTLRPADDLYRAHSTTHGAWWFSSDGSGRFDLELPAGTCYAGLSVNVAVRERVRDAALAGTVDVGLARKFCVSLLHVIDAVLLADVEGTADGAVTGLTRSLCSTDDYGRTGGWAQACHRDHFGGVLYPSAYTNGNDQRAVALFGEAGADRSRAEDPSPIPGPAAVVQAGLRLDPIPSSADVKHARPPARANAPSTEPPIVDEQQLR